MPVNKNAHARFQVIDTMLSSGGVHSKREMVRRLSEEVGEISDSTFDHDLQFMRNRLHAPIGFKPREGYYYEERRFRIFNNSMDESEANALDFAYEALNTMNNVELAEEAQAVLLRLNARRNDRPGKATKKIIYKPESPTVKGLEWLPTLYKAIQKEKALAIKYYKLATKEIKTHIISPYILRQYNDMWYVIAWSSGPELTLVYALDRIREIKTANVSYFQDPKFEPDQYFQYSYGITHSYYDKPQKVVFWIDRDSYYYLEVRPLHPSQTVLQETKTKLKVQIEVIISEELVMMLRGMGKRLSIESPQSLISKM